MPSRGREAVAAASCPRSRRRRAPSPICSEAAAEEPARDEVAGVAEHDPARADVDRVGGRDEPRAEAADDGDDQRDDATRATPLERDHRAEHEERHRVADQVVPAGVQERREHDPSRPSGERGTIPWRSRRPPSIWSAISTTHMTAAIAATSTSPRTTGCSAGRTRGPRRAHGSEDRTSAAVRAPAPLRGGALPVHAPHQVRHRDLLDRGLLLGSFSPLAAAESGNTL